MFLAPIWLFVTTGSLSCCHMTCIYTLLLSILVSSHLNVIQWHVCMSYCFPWLLDDSHTTSNDNFDEDDLEDKQLLPTSSVGEDAIVKEVHRWMSAGTCSEFCILKCNGFRHLMCSFSFIIVHCNFCVLKKCNGLFQFCSEILNAFSDLSIFMIQFIHSPAQHVICTALFRLSIRFTASVGSYFVLGCQYFHVYGIPMVLRTLLL